MGAGSSSAASPAAPRPALVRAIGRWDLTALVINGVIGSSIFGMPAVLAGLTGAWSPVTAILGGLGILTVLLCHAEVASRFTEPGGTYLYARQAFGRAIGFQAGWLSFWIRVTSMAANLNVFADYLAQLLPATGNPVGRAAVMCAVIALVTLLNVIGVRQGSRTVDLFTVAKLLPLGLLVALGVWRVRAEVLATQAAPGAVQDWTQAVLLLVFAYGGFEAALIPASEARDPRRDSAFALVTALAVIATAYALVQLTVVGLVPHAASVRAPVAAAFGVLLGSAGAALASVAAMISTYGWAVGATLATPRILYSMAEQGELPAALARVHARFRTPDISIYAFAAGGLAFGLAGGFAANATLSAIVRLVTYALVCASLPVFRRRPAMESPGFRLPAGEAVALLGLAFCVYLLSTRTFTQAWMLLALMAVGFVLWAAARQRERPPRQV